ncbi:unnamed protein product [Dicrocoelium dendriticum]|nr:unnamed protein product [Dicrocoelium dendriticum]
MARIHPGQSYLLSYNNLQLLGFVNHVHQGIGLSILHASVRLVNSSPFTVGIQLFSRVFVIWGILFLVPNSKHQTIAVPLTILSWCCAEIIRYLFYALNICNLVFYPVKLLRYSGFMLLYPTGISLFPKTINLPLYSLLLHHIDYDWLPPPRFM